MISVHHHLLNLVSCSALHQMLACYKNKDTNKQTNKQRNNMPQFITMYLTESKDTANKILVPNLINFMILEQNLF